jgi:rfaE bifunctional protein kinase chain/domain
MSASKLSARLESLIDRFEGRRIAVIGDPVLDCYIYGTTHRISREAPVLIVREDSREARLGGAANTASNLSALGASPSLAALIGADDGGTELIGLLAKKSISTDLVSRRDGMNTVTKTRVLAGAFHTTKQQMIRIDRENDRPPSEGDIHALVARAEDAVDRCDTLIISDYGDGSLTPTYAAAAQRAMAKKKIVIVDSRRALGAYKGVTAVTPNEPEAAAFLGVVFDNAQDAERAAIRLLDELDLSAVVLTRGKEGMAVAERGAPPVLMKAHGDHEAVDVTGAGDTVTATFALALTAGASVVEAATLANCAASVVVKSIGAATCSPSELKETIAELTDT